MLTITLVAFESLAVGTIMPVIARDLRGHELYGWVFSAFFLGSLVGISVVGALADRLGPGRPFALGLALFAGGLVLGGVAPSMEVLVAARLLQGLGAGTIQPTAYVVIGRSYPGSLRPRMFALLSTAWVLPGVAGPALSGVIAETIGWRIVLLGLLPLLALAALLGLPPVAAVAPDPDVQRSGVRRLVSTRLLPALVVAVGAGLVMAGLTSGEPLPLIGLLLGGVMLGVPAFRHLSPPGTLLARPGLPAAVLLRGILTFAFFAIDAYVALALVEGRGTSAAVAGLALTGATIAWSSGAWVQARMLERWGIPRLVRSGFAIALVGMLTFALVVVPAVPLPLVFLGWAVTGLGMGLAYSPLAVAVLRDAPSGTQGVASSALSLSDTLGTALGAGIAGAIIGAGTRLTGVPAPPTSLAVAFGMGIAVGVAGLLLAGRLRSGPTEGSVSA